MVAVALLPAPARAGCGLDDPSGDATVWDDAVLSGSYDQAVPSPSLDLVSAKAGVDGRFTTFTIRVADLATAAAEAPSGLAFSWDADVPSGVVSVYAWSAPTSSGVDVWAGRTVYDAKWVARTSGPVVDDATDTVTFTVATQTLGIRRGTPVLSTVRSYRLAVVDLPGRTVRQSAGADTVRGRRAPWGRC
jgi:hypothetical protein